MSGQAKVVILPVVLSEDDPMTGQLLLMGSIPVQLNNVVGDVLSNHSWRRVRRRWVVPSRDPAKLGLLLSSRQNNVHTHRR